MNVLQKIINCQTLNELTLLEKEHTFNEEEERCAHKKREEISTRIAAWQVKNEQLGIVSTNPLPPWKTYTLKFFAGNACRCEVKMPKAEFRSNILREFTQKEIEQHLPWKIKIVDGDYAFKGLKENIVVYRRLADDPQFSKDIGGDTIVFDKGITKRVWAVCLKCERIPAINLKDNVNMVTKLVLEPFYVSSNCPTMYAYFDGGSWC